MVLTRLRSLSVFTRVDDARLCVAIGVALQAAQGVTAKESDA